MFATAVARLLRHIASALETRLPQLQAANPAAVVEIADLAATLRERYPHAPDAWLEWLATRIADSSDGDTGAVDIDEVASGATRELQPVVARSIEREVVAYGDPPLTRGRETVTFDKSVEPERRLDSLHVAEATEPLARSTKEDIRKWAASLLVSTRSDDGGEEDKTERAGDRQPLAGRPLGFNRETFQRVTLRVSSSIQTEAAPIFQKNAVFARQFPKRRRPSLSFLSSTDGAEYPVAGDLLVQGLRLNENKSVSEGARELFHKTTAEHTGIVQTNPYGRRPDRTADLHRRSFLQKKDASEVPESVFALSNEPVGARPPPRARGGKLEFPDITSYADFADATPVDSWPDLLMAPSYVAPPAIVRFERLVRLAQDQVERTWNG